MDWTENVEKNYVMYYKYKGVTPNLANQFTSAHAWLVV